MATQKSNTPNNSSYSSSSENKTSLKRKILYGLLAFVAIISLLSMIPSDENSSDKKNQTGNAEELDKSIVTADKKWEMKVPSDWEETKELNDDADLQASNLKKEMYAIVMIEPKEDLGEGVDLQKYSELTYEPFIQNVANFKERKAPSEIDVNGNKALHYEYQGEVDDVKVIYLHRLLESPTHFVQIISWTLPSHWEENQSTLEKVIGTVKEIQ